LTFVHSNTAAETAGNKVKGTWIFHADFCAMGIMTALKIAKQISKNVLILLNTEAQKQRLF
jgi:hypothetical protein